MADLKISALTAATTPLGGTEVFPIVQSGSTVKASIANVQAAPVAAGTANAVQYLNGSKVPSTGTSLAFDGTYALGVGATLSAWAGNYRAVQAGSTAVFAGNTAGNRNYASSNVYWNGSNYKYITTSFATQLEQSDGAFYFLQAASGTAGNNISFATGMYLDTSSNLNVTGNVVMSTSGKGIDFSATPGTGTSELLADYEEGTWTPSLTGGTSGSATSGGNTYGNYTKVGRLVTLNFVITISAVSTLTGNVKLSGLPFNLAAGAAFENRYPQGSTIFGSLNTSWSSIVIGSDGGTTTLAFTGIKTPATGTTNVVAADLTATSFFAGSIQYIA